jgi:hypothetical protein
LRHSEIENGGLGDNPNEEELERMQYLLNNEKNGS